MAMRLNHRTKWLVAIAAAALVAAGAVAVSAGSRHFGGMVASLHGKMGGCPVGAVHAQLEQIVQELNLTPEQQAYLDRAHAVVETHFHEKGPSHADEMNALVTSIGEGTVDRAKVRAKIDEHIAEFRGVAYGVSDELVAFANSLDVNQRATLKNAITKMHESIHKSLPEHAHAPKGN